MLQRVTYSVERKRTNAQYVEFELSFSDISEASFYFYYRKNGVGRWFNDAILRSDEVCEISSNLVNNIQLDQGKCRIRWIYPMNKVDFHDSVEIEIRPEAIVKSIVYSGQKSYVSSFNIFGLNDVNIMTEKRFCEDVYVHEDEVYYNSQLLLSGTSSVLSVFKYSVSSQYRFIICDSGNGRIVDVLQDGTQQITVGSIHPVFCEYDSSTGYVLYADALEKDIKEIKWNLSSGTPDPSAGDVVWSYNSNFPSHPLSNPTSCSYGSSNKVVIVDTSVMVVDRDKHLRNVISQFNYKRDKEEEVDNQYSPNGISSAYEIDDGRLVVFESSGSALDYLPKTSHVTYNRSLYLDSSFPIHSAFYNDVFCPLAPVIGDDINVTLTVLNSRLLKSNMVNANVSSGQKVPIFDYIEEAKARGDVIGDVPFWGVRETYNSDTGMQTLVALTGQTANFSMPFNNRKVGYVSDTDGISPIYVSESISVNMIDAMTGVAMSCCEVADFIADQTFSFSFPDASQESHERSQLFGFHGLYLLNIVVNESYYENNKFETQVLPAKRLSFFVPIVTFWWRQVMKEIRISGSPVTSDFVLEDYSETPERFFDDHTVYPSYYRSVAGTALSIDSRQKKKIIYDNSFALLGYYVGFLLGDGSMSRVFGFNPDRYVSPKNDITTLQRRTLETFTADNRLAGLDAYYTSNNIFDDNPGEISSNTQRLTDFFGIIFSNMSSFSSIWGQNGYAWQPFPGSHCSSIIYAPNERKRLSFTLDLPNLIVDSITMYGRYIGDPHVRPGDPNVIVSFTTNSSPSEVTISLAIDGGPYVTYTDPTGSVREYKFKVQQTISSDSMIDAMVELVDSDGVRYAYYATQKAYNDTRVTSINNVLLSMDRTGKRLLIKFDFHAKYDFLPYNVKVSMISGLITDITDICQGDLYNIFSGESKQIILNYGEEYSEIAQKERRMIGLTFEPIGHTETEYQYLFSISFRSQDIWDHNIKEETAVFVVGDEETRNANKIVSTDHVYTNDSFLYGTLIFTDMVVPFNISSSSCSSSSSSSGSFSCSSSSSMSISSSSCSSSSSSSSSWQWQLYGYDVDGAGTSAINGQYCFDSYYNGRPAYNKASTDYWIRYENVSYIKWVIEDVTTGTYYVNPTDSLLPPEYGWITAPLGTNDAPQLSSVLC